MKRIKFMSININGTKKSNNEDKKGSSCLLFLSSIFIIIIIIIFSPKLLNSDYLNQLFDSFDSVNPKQIFNTNKLHQDKIYIESNLPKIEGLSSNNTRLLEGINTDDHDFVNTRFTITDNIYHIILNGKPSEELNTYKELLTNSKDYYDELKQSYNNYLSLENSNKANSLEFKNTIKHFNKFDKSLSELIKILKQRKKIVDQNID